MKIRFISNSSFSHLSVISIYFFDLIHYNRKVSWEDKLRWPEVVEKQAPQDKEALRIISEKGQRITERTRKKRIRYLITGIPAST